MWDIWRRCYPQTDENVSEEWGIESFNHLEQANQYIKDMERIYAEDSWKGHYLYRAKFYPLEARG